jgi:xanthine dehydrogenase accessory factor
VAAPDADRETFAEADSVQENFDLDLLKVTPQTFIVVSTQGESDEEALEAALQTGSSYIAFVASKTKAGKTLDNLRDRGITADKLRKVRAPAGLDIHASSPEEIAVSILAEIVQVRRANLAQSTSTASGLPVPQQEARDPICGMRVDASKAKHKSEFQGTSFYFCCAGCKQTFDKQPEKHVLAVEHS